MKALGNLRSTLIRVFKDCRAAMAAEYAFLIAFIAIVGALGMVALGPSIADYFTAVTQVVPDTSANPPCPMGGCDP